MTNRRNRPPSPAQQAVVELLREGLTNAAIADRLGVTVGAVEHHVTRLYRKVGLRGHPGRSGRAELVRRLDGQGDPGPS